MVDRFVDRVANLAGLTSKTLEEIAKVADEAGLPHGNTLRRLAREHSKIALDCLVETQPIEVQRFAIHERIETSIRILQELSADMMSRGEKGHNDVEEAADLLQSALEKSKS